MTTKISIDNIQQAAVNTIVTSAVSSVVTLKISSIAIANSSYTILDDTAVDVNGGYIVITGTGFSSNCQVIVDGVAASSTTFVNSTTLRAQVGARTAGTYNVYVTDTNGDFAIRVNGLTYSSLPAWVTGTTLTGADDGQFISINFSANDATSYVVQSGSSLPSGLTLSANGYLYGTVTGLSTETTYSFTVVAIDAEAQDSPRTFNITITAGDPYFNYVSLLLSGDTTSNTYISDVSTNNFQLTTNGDVRANPFHPFNEGNYSILFDGTDDYLQYTSSTTLNFGTADFTVECWVNLNSVSTSQVIIGGTVSNSFGFRFGTSYNVAQGLSIYRAAQADLENCSFTFQTGRFYHIAVVRQSGAIKFFIDGVQQTTNGSGGGSYNYGAENNVRIGSGDTGFEDFNGFISNLRVVKGTAVYTSNFTPTTTPLTAISGTSLLTCQSNRFVDNSTNNFTITRNGDVSVHPFNPFVAIDATANGSSYFDGTDDGINCGSQTAFALGTGPFCLEGWVYNIALKNYSCLWTTRPNNGSYADAYHIGWDSAGGASLYVNTTSYAGVASGTIKTGQWQHIAVTRNAAGNLAFFVDGVRAGYTASLTSDFSRSLLGLGDFPTTKAESINGYISNARIVKGSHVYDPTQSTCTVPTSPLTAIANTSILTAQTKTPSDNQTIIDVARNALITRSGNTTQGSFSPYGDNWSNYFDGTGDYLSIADNDAFHLSGNFTIECWAYVNLVHTGRILSQQGTSGTGVVMLRAVNGSIEFFIASPAGTTLVSLVSSVISTNQWHHIAAVRNSNTFTLFINGVSVANTTADISVPNVSEPLFIGTYTAGSEGFNGYLSNVRIIKGTALYTSNFTPSTTPLQPIANTSLLTCRDGSFVDDGPNAFAITRNGDVRVSKFSPFVTSRLATPYYSGYFDGTGDLLTLSSNSALNVGSGDFSIEMWLYPFNWTATYSPFFVGGGTGGIWIGKNGSNFVLRAYGVADQLQYATMPTVGSWTHVVFARTGSTLSMYYNGTRVATTTNSYNFTQQTTYIGGDGAADFYTGHISNLRLNKGSSVYDATQSSITVPTSPISAIANTSLLTCTSNTLIDTSNNNFAITASGDVRPTLFSPFTVSYTTKETYTSNTFGGSGYFDGTDYLSFTNTNSLISFGTGNFTIEYWVNFNNPTSTNTYDIIFRNYIADPFTTDYFYLGKHASATVAGAMSLWVANFSTSVPLLSDPSLPSAGWTHYAIVRSGNTWTMYRNGRSVHSVTSSISMGTRNNNECRIGENLPGYISDLRIVKGTAVYTSNFTPSITPLTSVSGTSLLLNYTNAAIFDGSMKNDSETSGNVRLSTSVKKYGNSSIYFDGTTDYLLLPTSTNFGYGTGDFTIEFWVYFNTVSLQTIVSNLTSASSVNPHLYLNGSNATIRYYTNNADRITGSAVVSNTWYHVALCRASGSTKLFINGTQSGSTYADSNNYGQTAPFAIGTYYSSGSPYTSEILNGYIDDLRITNGVARYTSNFTPPTQLLAK